MKSKLLGYGTQPCHNCGTETEFDDVFCQECGSRLHRSEPKVSPAETVPAAVAELYRRFRATEFFDRLAKLPKPSPAQIVLPAVLLGFLVVTWAVHAIDNSFDSLSEKYIAGAAKKALQQNKPEDSAELLLRAYTERSHNLSREHIELLGNCLLQAAAECIRTGRFDKAEKDLHDVPKECNSYSAAQAQLSQLPSLRAEATSNTSNLVNQPLRSTSLSGRKPVKKHSAPPASTANTGRAPALLASIPSTVRETASTPSQKPGSANQQPSPQLIPPPPPNTSSTIPDLVPAPEKVQRADSKSQQTQSSGFFIDGVEISPETEHPRPDVKRPHQSAQNQQNHPVQAERSPITRKPGAITPPDEPAKRSAARSGAERSGNTRGASDVGASGALTKDISKYNELLVRYFGKRRGSTIASENEAGQEPPSLQEWIDKGKPDFR